MGFGEIEISNNHSGIFLRYVQTFFQECKDSDRSCMKNFKAEKLFLADQQYA